MDRYHDVGSRTTTAGSRTPRAPKSGLGCGAEPENAFVPRRAPRPGGAPPPSARDPRDRGPRFGSLKSAGGRSSRCASGRRSSSRGGGDELGRPAGRGEVVVDERARRHGRHVDRLVRAVLRQAQGSGLAREGRLERGDAHVYDGGHRPRAPGRRHARQLQAPGGSLAWDAHADGFYYTRYPRPGERPRPTSLLHAGLLPPVGTPETQDRYEIGRTSAHREIDLRARRRPPTSRTCRTATAVSSSSTCGGRTARGRGCRDSRTGCSRRSSTRGRQPAAAARGRVRRAAG